MPLLYFCSWTGTFSIIITITIDVVPLLGCERNSRVQFGKAICNLCNISLYCETNYYELHICTHFGKSCSWLSVYCANFLVDCPTQLHIFLVDFKVFFCQLLHMTYYGARKLKKLLEYFFEPKPFSPVAHSMILSRFYCYYFPHLGHDSFMSKKNRTWKLMKASYVIPSALKVSLQKMLFLRILRK